MQCVEGVEELLLRGFLALQELDIVHDQHVEIAVFALELLAAVVGDGVNEVVGQLFTGDVAHAHIGLQLLGIVADGVQQVGFAEARFAPNEQRIIGASWGFGDGATGGVRELVGAADDEAFEGVLLVQQGVRVPVAHVRVRGCGRRRLGRRECLVVGFWLLGALMLLGQALGGEDAGVLILFWGFGGGSGLGMCWGLCC